MHEGVRKAKRAEWKRHLQNLPLVEEQQEPSKADWLPLGITKETSGPFGGDHNSNFTRHFGVPDTCPQVTASGAVAVSDSEVTSHTGPKMDLEKREAPNQAPLQGIG